MMPLDIIGTGPDGYVCASRFIGRIEGFEDLLLGLQKLDVLTNL